MSDFSKILSSIKKKNPDSFPDVKVVGNVDRVTLGSPNMNYVLGATLGKGTGAPRGRILELYGPESGGKCLLGSTEITIKVDDDFLSFLKRNGYA
jgi:RecA/RadA recombinase